MAKFDVLASVTQTRAGSFFVMVSIAPRVAWSARSQLAEFEEATLEEAERRCREMIDAAREQVERRGDELGSVIGPRWDPPTH